MTTRDKISNGSPLWVEVIDSLERVARGEIWPLVTETYRLEEAEIVHERLEKSLVTGRAALRIQ